MITLLLNPLFVATLLGAFAWLAVFVVKLIESERSSPRPIAVLWTLGLVCVVPPAVSVITGSQSRGEPTSTALATSWVLSFLFLITLLVLLANARGEFEGRVLLGALVVYWLLGVLANYYNGLPTGRLSVWLVPFALLCIPFLSRERERAKKSSLVIFTLICYASLFLSIVAPRLAYFGPTRLLTSLLPERLAGITEYPNSLGLVAATAILLLINERPRLWWLQLAIVSVVLIETESRAAWFGALTGATILLVARVGARSGRVIQPPALLALAALPVSAELLFLKEHATRPGELITFDGRLSIWQTVLHRWSESPAIGSGPGIWRKLTADGVLPATAGQAHNQFLETLFTVGVLGVVVLLAIAAIWLSQSLRAAKSGDVLPLALFALAVSVGAFEIFLDVASFSQQFLIVVAFAVLMPFRMPARLRQSATAQDAPESQVVSVHR